MILKIVKRTYQLDKEDCLAQLDEPSKTSCVLTFEDSGKNSVLYFLKGKMKVKNMGQADVKVELSSDKALITARPTFKSITFDSPSYREIIRKNIERFLDNYNSLEAVTISLIKE